MLEKLKFGKELHIWSLSIDLSIYNKLLKYRDCLTSQEVKEANLYIHQTSKSGFIISRIALRLLVSHYTNVSPHDIHFEQGAYGKPYLANMQCSFLNFNISHTNSEIAIVFSLIPVGIDIEYADPNLLSEKYDELFRLALSPEELIEMEHVTLASQRIEKFYEIWTKKEALFKGLGTGITNKFNKLTLSNKNKYFDPVKGKTWQLTRYKGKTPNIDGYVAYSSKYKHKIKYLNIFKNIQL